MTHTGQLLRKMRTTRNLTQQALADLLGVNKSAIGQIEGKADCSTTTLRKWTEALDFEWEVAVREKEYIKTNGCTNARAAELSLQA